LVMRRSERRPTHYLRCRKLSVAFATGRAKKGFRLAQFVGAEGPCTSRMLIVRDDRCRILVVLTPRIRAAPPRSAACKASVASIQARQRKQCRHANAHGARELTYASAAAGYLHCPSTRDALNKEKERQPTHARTHTHGTCSPATGICVGCRYDNGILRRCVSWREKRALLFALAHVPAARPGTGACYRKRFSGPVLSAQHARSSALFRGALRRCRAARALLLLITGPRRARRQSMPEVVVGDDDGASALDAVCPGSSRLTRFYRSCQLRLSAHGRIHDEAGGATTTIPWPPVGERERGPSRAAGPGA
jgi:hypothetical protein